MNILLVHPLIPVGENQVTFGAVEYYRMYKPHLVLSKLHPEYTYTTTDSVINQTDEALKEFDMILFSRIILRPDETSARLNKLGIKFGLDLDDYWHLDDRHLLYERYKSDNTTALIAKSINVAHFVFCTTSILASYIKPLNPNVYVLPNGIDTDDEVWKPKRIFSDRTRFGFTQGDTHLPDMMLIDSGVQNSLYTNRFRRDGQIVLCGFKGNMTVSIGYERLLTKDLKAIPDKNYVSRLMQMTKESPTDQPYRRIWALDIDEFPTIYDSIDVSVVPLRDTLFNSCKSNIKMLEAGFKGCAVMVSNVSPYKEFATKENSFLLSEKGFYEWQSYIINNPEIIKEKVHYLSRDVRKYSLNNLTKERADVYKHLWK